MHSQLSHIDAFVKAAGGKLLKKPQKNTVLTGISTNSRDIQKGNIFIPLIGEKFDAHSFIDGALEQGAGTFIQKEKIKEIEIEDKDKYVIEVEDTLQALQILGRENRSLVQGMQVIGVTGSNGKTTTKEILGALLQKLSKDVFISMKNLNNHIGVPINLMELTDDVRFSVFEMGASAVGEIDLLASLVLPDISIITNVAPAHLEGFKTIENILKTKTEIFKHTKRVKIVNHDNQYLKSYADNHEDVITFGFEEGSTLQIIQLITREEHQVLFKYKGEKYRFKSPLPGVHNIYNLLGALLAIEALGFEMKALVELVDGLFIEVSGRLKKLKHQNHVIYDDSYNSNPLSVRAGVEYFCKKEQEEKKYLILGEMKELGEHSRFYHQDIGQFLNKYKFESIFLIGEESKHVLAKLNMGTSVKWFESLEELKEAFKSLLASNTAKAFYIKGSRGNKLDTLVKMIEE